MNFSIRDFFSKCEQIRRKLRIWSHLLKKSLMENFIFCEVLYLTENAEFNKRSTFNTYAILDLLIGSVVTVMGNFSIAP